MSISDASEFLVNAGPAILLWCLGAIGFLVLVISGSLIANKWPLFTVVAMLAAVAYQGHALWLIAALLALLAFLVHGTLNELERTRATQAGVAQKLDTLATALDGIRSALESLDPEVREARKAQQKAMDDYFAQWTAAEAAEEGSAAKPPQESE